MLLLIGIKINSWFKKYEMWKSFSLVVFMWLILNMVELSFSKSMKNHKLLKLRSSKSHRRTKRQTDDDPQATPSREYFANSYLAFPQSVYQSSQPVETSNDDSVSASSTYSFPDRIRYASLTDPASTQAPTRMPTTTASSRYRGQAHRGGSVTGYTSSSSSMHSPSQTPSSNYYYGQPSHYNTYQQQSYPRGLQTHSSPYGYGHSSYTIRHPSSSTYPSSSQSDYSNTYSQGKNVVYITPRTYSMRFEIFSAKI